MFPERLKELRKRETGLTQEKIASQLGIAKTTYASYEQGKRQPDLIILSKIADRFGITTDYLLGRKVDLGDVPVAAHLRNGLSLDDLPDDRRKEVEEYIEYQKARYKKDLEDGRIKKD